MPLDPRALIADAFRAAAQSGRSGDAMTPAVLKNRMIQLSSGVFDEKVLGYESFSDFIAAHSDVLAVDRSARPPAVRLAVAAGAGPRPIASDAVRIRPDLWQAVMDYSSDKPHVWDPASGTTKPGDVGSTLALPATSPVELHVLRSRFDAEHRSSASEAERVRLASWLDNDLGTSALPPRLRGPWNQSLKVFVQGKLVQWFREKGIELPRNVVQAVDRPAVRKADDFRVWVHAVVDAMTDEELRALDLPAPATFRASRR